MFFCHFNCTFFQIKVQPKQQTSDADIYALGDVAELPNGKLYVFILPIRRQAHWLAGFIAGQEQQCWTPPCLALKPKCMGLRRCIRMLFS
jgi:NAD(P)H-nitrite reductase large subunit